MEKDASIMSTAILFGGHRVGFNTNPEADKVSCFIVINGEKLVCVAQGGECRYNHRFYTSGMNDTKGWTTPIIDETCPNRCGYKMIVCDDHDDGRDGKDGNDGHKCRDSIEYYPQYNKFRGLFKRYCRSFDKFEIRDGQKDENIDRKRDKNRKEIKEEKDGTIIRRCTDEY